MTSLYSSAGWRELPRDGECVASFLFGPAVGDCDGPIHRHHVVPGDPESRSVQVCRRHHPSLEAALRRLVQNTWRRCPHYHPYPEGRAECERRINEAA